MKTSSLLLFLLAIVVGCDNSTEVQIQDAYINTGKLQKVLEETVQEHNVPGAVMLVKFDDGSIWKEAYGLANIDSGNVEKMNIEKSFRIGSVTKTFIGTAILILVKQGVINLFDNIESLMPGLLKYGDIITVEMLLNQTSALPSYTWDENFMEIYYYNPTYDWNSEEIYDLFKDENLLSTNNDTSYYSNSNYYLLGSIIEKYSDKELNQFLSDEIFSPLGMSNTYFPTDDFMVGDYTHGYFDLNQDGNFTQSEDYTIQNSKAIWAAGGIVSTVEDLLIWNDELLSGSLLNELLQSMRMTIDVPLAGAPTGVYYGLGIADLFGAIGHTGAVAGYSTILFKYNNTTFIAYGNGYETEGKRLLIADDLFEKAKEALFQ